ncbi:hypothetical protein [Lysinibacillus fusiformis]|uniref:hypothetical protein n=1 Tax=Lysinibacillus fusiformis TaxID=28031 RepID=UPI00215AE166|nr:hypothetical protein [Lysinibacillus fusiformis]MCR8854874.1 hypothetical protein [Lysinibacillus fusiformis]WKT77143.1 hypothetical protein QYY55_24700 [Lysinibacillus fusiformis]
MELFNDYIEKAKEMEPTFEDKIVAQKGIMRSESFNENFEYIERMLNKLYEKTRILQNISEYTRTFLKTQVVGQKEELYELLKEAETTRDSIKRDGYKKRTLLFTEDLTAKKIDRDGIEIAPTSVSNGAITLLGKEEEFVPIKEVKVDREIALTQSNNKNILDGEPVRNFYLLDGPAPHGVAETYKLEFEKESYVTQIDIQNVNSDIKVVELIDKTNKKIQVTKQAATGFKRQLVSSVEVTIVDTSYRQVTYEYDATRMSSDFWHKVAQKEYAKEMGLSNSFDLEKESGLRQYKEDYQTYLNSVSAWEAERNAVDQRNAQMQSAYESAYSAWAINNPGAYDRS